MATKKQTDWPISFEIVFENTSYTVGVVVHKSLTHMRRALNDKKFNANDAFGVCWQFYTYDPKNQTSSEIHLAKDHFTYETTSHEAAHAAFHLTRLCGVKGDADDFQEIIATYAGLITEAIIYHCHRVGLSVGYEPETTQDNLRYAGWSRSTSKRNQRTTPSSASNSRNQALKPGQAGKSTSASPEPDNENTPASGDTTTGARPEASSSKRSTRSLGVFAKTDRQTAGLRPSIA